MHTGRSYKTTEFLYWTRRSIFWLLLWSAIPTVLYQVLDWKWLTIPWPVAALLGVPISQMSRTVEIDIREMLGEVDLPPAMKPQNDIVL